MSIKTPDNSLGEALAAILIMAYNPLTYRGYTFAPALGYNYYLGSRFYIPQLCRFMNADVYADTAQGVVGTNMFAYCNNNPISFVDPNGLAAYSQLSTVVNTIKLIAYMSIIIKYAKDNNIVFNEGIFRDYVSRITTKKSTYNSFVKQLYATILTLYGTHIYNLFDIASLYIDLFDLAGVKYTASMGKVIGVLPFAADIVKDFYSPFLSTDVVMNNLFNHILDFMGGSMITTLSTAIGTAVGSTLGQPILGFMVGFVVYLAATNLWQEFSNG